MFLSEWAKNKITKFESKMPKFIRMEAPEVNLSPPLELKPDTDKKVMYNPVMYNPVKGNQVKGKMEEEEYEIVEKEILPEKMICPDCGGITLVGLDFCDKCGGELINQDN